MYIVITQNRMFFQVQFVYTIDQKYP